ncbi:hypothetical protein [Nonomuraea dietziae]|uniref:hypothetical protein n=1 Tax=Nonomuraea dietziae TaxID=65515 RepID=UPI0031DBB8F8
MAFSTTLEKLSTAGLFGLSAMLSSKPPVLSADPAPVAKTSATSSSALRGSLSSASSQARREAAIARRDRRFMCRHSERGANVRPSSDGACPAARRPAAIAAAVSAMPVPAPVTGPSPLITACLRGAGSYGTGSLGLASTSETLLPPKA